MKSVGFFSEMELYKDDGPLKSHLVDVVNYDKERIIEYLESFRVKAICARRSIDCGTGNEIADGFCVYNDGEYEWCDFLTYHIQKYNIELPLEFIKKANALK